MTQDTLFILPPRETVEATRRTTPGERDYSLYNYYGFAPIARAKHRRFERALRLIGDRRGGRVIDMGCADGILLPTLSRDFEHVAAVDINDAYLDQARGLRDALNLPNVSMHCNAGLSFEQLRDRLGPGYSTMTLLETLEHVGRQPDTWQSRVEFLRNCFTLLEGDGRIVISVPKMVGPAMLVKQMIQRSLGLGYDEMTVRQLLRSSLLYDTDELEPLWDGHHVGFNHLKLDRHMQNNFRVLRREESMISVFYLIEQAPARAVRRWRQPTISARPAAIPQ